MGIVVAHYSILLRLAPIRHDIRHEMSGYHSLNTIRTFNIFVDARLFGSHNPYQMMVISHVILFGGELDMRLLDCAFKLSVKSVMYHY